MRSRVCASRAREHGVVLRTLICLALGISPAMAWNFHIGNTRRFESKGAILWRLNDTCHLNC